jgi:hypothetical protein
MLPVIHRPTFNPEKDPVVTLAIVCIGSRYTEYKGAHTFANLLSELTRRVLLFMVIRAENLMDQIRN